MHSYLRAIGFGKLKKESEIEKLLDEVYADFTSRTVVKKEHGAFVEMRKSFGPDMGIVLCGVMDEAGFHKQYYFPYYKGSGVTTKEDLIIEKRVDGDSYAGVCDDPRIGVSMIFYLQNAAAYQNRKMEHQLFGKPVTTTFSGLAASGMILMPVQGQETREISSIQEGAKRNQLVSAAKNGDPEAIESLTIEDMDLYSMISRRISKEDVYSIVDTFFMPYGMECDQYQVMGNIKYYHKVQNPVTGEKVYQITVECNDMEFDICINAADLMGEPEVGRRFKGMVWLQGRVNFE